MNEIMRDQTVSTDDKKYYLSMKDTIICESPKTYIDGVAYNDGSWVIFNTFKSKKSGKIIGNIKINSKESFIKTIYSYMVFLKMTGIRNNKALVYFSIVFFDRLTYQKGLFDFNNKNIGILYNLAEKVLKKLDQELTKDWTRGRTKDRIGCWDDRKFCMDTKGMNKSDTSKRRNKILNKKKELDEKIGKYADLKKSIKDNLAILHSCGIKVSKSRYCLWLKDQRLSKTDHSLDDDRLSKTDHSLDNDRLSKTDHSLDNRLSKTDYNYYINSRSSLVDKQQAQSNERKKKTEALKLYGIEEFYDKEELVMIRKDLERERQRTIREQEVVDDFFF